jgi:hypothetical protein
MIRRAPNYYQPSYLPPRRFFATGVVSPVKKVCKFVSSVIQSRRIAERLPKFREEFSAGQGARREAPLLSIFQPQPAFEEKRER